MSRPEENDASRTGTFVLLGLFALVVLLAFGTVVAPELRNDSEGGPDAGVTTPE